MTMQPITDAENADEMWSTVEHGCSDGDGPRTAPCARGKHSATLLGGHVYVLGGRGSGGALPLRDFWRYSLASGVWERLECRGEPPPSLQEHSATAHGAKLYVFGGEAGALSNETPLWIYDTETQLWRKLPGEGPAPSSVRRRWSREPRSTSGVGPRGRRGHSAHALNDCLLIYGGYKDLRGSTNELWAFHYETETWQAVRARGAGAGAGAGAGPARHRHAAVLHGARLYVHAGQCDLRDCSDLWHLDTITRVWSVVRGSGKASPGARSGHAAARAGSHMYVFGGEVDGHAANDMWRFHFVSECWERVETGGRGPSARVDGRALLVCGALGARGAPAAPEGRGGAGAGRLARLTSLQLRRGRGSYTALADKDSTESLVRHERALAKSQSAYVIERPHAPAPDFADAPPQPKLVCLDSDDEERVRAMPKSASVRFTRGARDEDEGDTSTSDYASAERVNGALAFSNPHYLGPDVRRLLTPDSGVAPAPGDVELRELRPPAPPPALHLLLVGGREPPHLARLHGPLSMWTYRLL